ncbi:hypothetical protein B0T24DRAFT_535291, partial [Lasiosphaeria ovina]
QQLPGVRCPTCASNGQEVWVIRGRACGHCGTACFRHQTHTRTQASKPNTKSHATPDVCELQR